MQVPIGPPRIVKASAFVRNLSTGRNKAVVLTVVDSDHEHIECVVKPAAYLESPSLANTVYLYEWLASVLARRLGLHAPEPFCVEITQNFASSLFGNNAVHMSQSIGFAFGCKWVAGLKPVLNTTSIPVEYRQSAADILIFDVFVHNIDRRKQNPNLGQSTDGFVIYDHDLAFSFIGAILAPDPVFDPLPWLVQDHVFSGRFGNLRPSNEEIGSTIAGLNESDFDAILADVPSVWTSGDAGNILKRIVSTMKQRSAAVSRWLSQVKI